MTKRIKIVLTGGPGGGKTTAADLFRRELGSGVEVVPEAATLLFGGGFPRCNEAEAVQRTQRAIYHVQENLEDVCGTMYSTPILLCDRGTLDGAAYWPGGSDDYFESMGTSLQRELSRYDAVVFFETAAAGDQPIRSGNPIRTETNAQAVVLDRKLRELWEKHENFHFIANSRSFMEKLTEGVELLHRLCSAKDSGRPEHS